MAVGDPCRVFSAYTVPDSCVKAGLPIAYRRSPWRLEGSKEVLNFGFTTVGLLLFLRYLLFFLHFLWSFLGLPLILSVFVSHWLYCILRFRVTLLTKRCWVGVAESQTIEDFGAALHLMRADLEHLRSVFLAVENGDLGMLKSLGIKDSELGDVKFFLEKLVNTGFLD
ncbi:hypothetical protein FOCC_FOCC007389 [Frankliniella occidentalis]|nr:hypothetical protein FOCC_FOCC007389 [Frankliniella occidentalis]